MNVINNSLKSRLTQSCAVFFYYYRLLFKNWIRSYMNLFLAVGVSLYTMLCWLAFKSNDPFLLVSGLCVGVIRNSMYTYLKTLNDLYNRGFKERIKTIPTSQLFHSFIFISYNFLSTLLIVVFMFCIAIAIFPSQTNLIAEANWSIVTTGFIMLWITCICVATFLHLYIKRSKISEIICLLIYFGSLYFLGLAFPYYVVTQYKWVEYMLNIFPQKAFTNIIQIGFVKANTIGITHYYNGTAIYVTTPLTLTFRGNDETQWFVSFGYWNKLWAPYFIGTLIICLLWGFNIAKYNFKTIDEKIQNEEVILTGRSKNYIKTIRHAKSIEELTLLKKNYKKDIFEIKKTLKNKKYSKPN